MVSQTKVVQPNWRTGLSFELVIGGSYLGVFTFWISIVLRLSSGNTGRQSKPYEAWHRYGDATSSSTPVRTPLDESLSYCTL